MSTPEGLRQRITDLREAFDRSFAEPVHQQPSEVVDLLAIEIGDDSYAIRLDAIGGLAADRPLAALPGAPPALLGVATFRSAIVPVYDLGRLLGFARSTSPRWTVIAAGQPVLALAFDRVAGHLRRPRATGVATGERSSPAADGRAFTSDQVDTPAGARAIIDVAAVRAAIVAQCHPGGRGGGDEHDA
jgi:chemotaxis signal transduction protein